MSQANPKKMPAVELSRLKKQIATLAERFDQPEAFLRILKEILDYYVNRTLRTHNAAAPRSVLPTYRTPQLVMRQLENELASLADARPLDALVLADELWDAGYLETKLLAAFLIGRIPAREERLLARLTAWTQQIRDPNVKAVLLTSSLTKLRQQEPERFLSFVGEWLHPARKTLWGNGIQALLPLIRDDRFDNLPPVYALVRPVIESIDSQLQTPIIELLTSLYETSEIETVHYLRQIIADNNDPQFFTILRRTLPLLPETFSKELREMLRKKKG